MGTATLAAFFADRLGPGEAVGLIHRWQKATGLGVGKHTVPALSGRIRRRLRRIVKVVEYVIEDLSV